MNRPELRRGDIFCTLNPSLLAWIIRNGQKIWSDDPKVEFGHAGIIDKADIGQTIEALWTVRLGKLSKYKGKYILIGRCVKTLADVPVTQDQLNGVLNDLSKDQMGRHYPIHRLLLHALGPTGKWGTGDYLVCSELGGKLAWMVDSINWYKGMNPDELGEILRRHREFDVIHDGIWTWDFDD